MTLGTSPLAFAAMPCLPVSCSTFIKPNTLSSACVSRRRPRFAATSAALSRNRSSCQDRSGRGLAACSTHISLISPSVQRSAFLTVDRSGFGPSVSTCAAVAGHGAQIDPSTDQLTVCTTDGQVYQLDIIAGVTTVGNIRSSVAQKMNTEVGMVRLAYQGRELPVSDDTKVFGKRAGIEVIHAMKRPTAAETPPQPNTEVLKVYTMEGKQHNLTVTPGVTTAGDIRRAVASATGASRSEVRLQYAGQELDPSSDNRVMQFKPSMFVMHTMKRMQGGGSSSSIEAPSSTLATPARRRRKPGISELRIQRGTTSITPFQAARLAQTAFDAVDKGAKSGAKPAVIMSEAETAPGGGRGPAVAQLAKQFRDLMKHPIPGVSAAPDDEDPLKWHVKLAGPEGTPYADGWFHVELRFQNNFPGSRPAAFFQNKIWHPNVEICSGKVCINIGDEVCSVGCVLSALQQLLKHPNPESPFNEECAEQMMKRPLEYQAKARSMTHKHAMS